MPSPPYSELVKRLTNFEVFPEHEMFFQGAQVEIQFKLWSVASALLVTSFF